MMKVYENKEYMEDVGYIAGLDLPWNKLQDKSVLISGATGLVGSCLVDVIMKRNENGMNCKVYALGRNKLRADERFGYCSGSKLFEFVPYDISTPLVRDDIGTVDYVLHLASNTHPLQYSTDPIGTITTNISVEGTMPRITTITRILSAVTSITIRIGFFTSTPTRWTRTVSSAVPESTSPL